MCLYWWHYTFNPNEDKNGSHRYDINIPMSRHGDKYIKYKTCLSMMMLICIKQHLSNIWNLIHEKVKQDWAWVEKSVAYKTTVYPNNKNIVTRITGKCWNRSSCPEVFCQKGILRKHLCQSIFFNKVADQGWWLLL